MGALLSSMRHTHIVFSLTPEEGPFRYLYPGPLDYGDSHLWQVSRPHISLGKEATIVRRGYYIASEDEEDGVRHIDWSSKMFGPGASAESARFINYDYGLSGVWDGYRLTNQSDWPEELKLKGRSRRVMWFGFFATDRLPTGHLQARPRIPSTRVWPAMNPQFTQHGSYPLILEFYVAYSMRATHWVQVEAALAKESFHPRLPQWATRRSLTTPSSRYAFPSSTCRSNNSSSSNNSSTSATATNVTTIKNHVATRTTTAWLRVAISPEPIVQLITHDPPRVLAPILATVERQQPIQPQPIVTVPQLPLPQTIVPLQTIVTVPQVPLPQLPLPQLPLPQPIVSLQTIVSPTSVPMTVAAVETRPLRADKVRKIPQHFTFTTPVPRRRHAPPF